MGCPARKEDAYRSFQNLRLARRVRGNQSALLNPEFNVPPAAVLKRGPAVSHPSLPVALGCLAAPCAGLAVLAGRGLIAQTLVQRGLGGFQVRDHLKIAARDLAHVDLVDVHQAQ